jgi:hypothetical protein
MVLMVLDEKKGGGATLGQADIHRMIGLDG